MVKERGLRGKPFYHKILQHKTKSQISANIFIFDGIVREPPRSSYQFTAMAFCGLHRLL